MKIEQQDVGTVHVLKPIGALVEDDAQDLSIKLNDRLESGNVRIVLDLHEVPYMDSAALEGLLVAADTMAGCAMSLRLARVSGTCREILELTDCADHFVFFENVHDAVKSYL